jgi:hypothetical protein
MRWYSLVDVRNYLILMVRPERFELPTSWFVARRSIQLSYGRNVQTDGHAFGRLHRRGAGSVRRLGPTPSGARILPYQLRPARSVLGRPAELQSSVARHLVTY